jgi:hypothetical protein
MSLLLLTRVQAQKVTAFQQALRQAQVSVLSRCQSTIQEDFARTQFQDLIVQDFPGPFFLDFELQFLVGKFLGVIICVLLSILHPYFFIGVFIFNFYNH